MRWENDQHVIQVLPAPYSQQGVGSPRHCMINPGCSRSIWIVNQPVQEPICGMCIKCPERTQVAGSPHGGQMFLFFPNLHEKTSSKLLPFILFPSFLSEGLMMWQKAFGPSLPAQLARPLSRQASQSNSRNTIPTLAPSKIGNNLLEVLKKQDSNMNKQPMPHTASRNTTLFCTPVETQTSHPRTVADWLLVVSEGLDHNSGLVCSGRLPPHKLHSPPGAPAGFWSSVPVGTAVQGNFPNHLEKVRSHAESESRGGESPAVPWVCSTRDSCQNALPLQNLFHAAPGAQQSRAHRC